MDKLTTKVMKKAFINWSSGKDAALALYRLQLEKEFEVSALMTNVNGDFGRVSMHGLREELLDAQAESIGLPLKKLYFPAEVSMDLYNKTMREQCSALKNEGYNYAVFGDIFLEDLREYRDGKLKEAGLEGVYPLWKQDTKGLFLDFLSLGFKAITVCVNAKLLGEEFVGRIIDEDFINDLPDGVDICGENGEFHSFVFDGPIFNRPVEFQIGEKVRKSYTLHEDDDDNCFQSNDDEDKNYDTSFWYCDLTLDS